ncbi:hypothetical protein C2S52_006238 [Perilla frutescens var. hirtella]|nr:hypothetical protein C2S51_009541 [Perilla frutescens var. frutescens]KAH6786686.1 hypothetical protein C2S52_006238 [Perilla frutescens var. hirtella]
MPVEHPSAGGALRAREVSLVEGTPQRRLGSCTAAGLVQLLLRFVFSSYDVRAQLISSLLSSGASVQAPAGQFS